MAEPQAGAEKKEGERHEGGHARHDALALREQVSGDTGDEEPENERDLLGSTRGEQGDPTGELGRPEEERETRTAPAAWDVCRESGHEQEAPAERREYDGQNQAQAAQGELLRAPVSDPQLMCIHREHSSRDGIRTRIESPRSESARGRRLRDPPHSAGPGRPPLLGPVPRLPTERPTRSSPAGPRRSPAGDSAPSIGMMEWALPAARQTRRRYP